MGTIAGSTLTCLRSSLDEWLLTRFRPEGAFGGGHFNKPVHFTLPICRVRDLRRICVDQPEWSKLKKSHSGNLLQLEAFYNPTGRHTSTGNTQPNRLRNPPRRSARTGIITAITLSGKPGRAPLGAMVMILSNSSSWWAFKRAGYDH